MPRPISTFGDVTSSISAELADLLALQAAGRLSAQIGLHTHWQHVHDTVTALFARKVRGMVVLDAS